MLGVLCGFVVVRLHSAFGIRHFSSANVPEPANVLTYLFFCVGVPFLLVLALALLIRNPWGLAELLGVRPLFNLFARWIAKLVAWLVSHGTEHIDQSARERMQAGMGIIRARLGEHRSTLKWPFLVTLQSFGLGFAASIPLTTLVLMAGSDRGFGWQTSLPRMLSPENIECGVRLASLPWSWMPAQWATQPNTDSIHNSRVSYISDGSNLTDGAVKAWGPFLVLCTTFWGFLPRVLLLVVALRGQRKALDELWLNDCRCDGLFRRLTTPILAPPSENGSNKPATVPHSIPARHVDSKIPVQWGKCIVMVPCDLRDFVESNHHILESLLERHRGLQIHQTLIVGESAANNRQVLQKLTDAEWSNTRDRQIVYLEDAAESPIRGDLDFLRKCRIAAGEHSRITVGLINTPDTGLPFSNPRTEDVNVWQGKIDSLGDLRIALLLLAQ